MSLHSHRSRSVFAHVAFCAVALLTSTASIVRGDSFTISGTDTKLVSSSYTLGEAYDQSLVQVVDGGRVDELWLNDQSQYSQTGGNIGKLLVTGNNTVTVSRNTYTDFTPGGPYGTNITATENSTVTLGPFRDNVGGTISATDRSTIVSNGFWSEGTIYLSGQSHALLASGSPLDMSMTDQTTAEWRGGSIEITTVGPEASLIIDGGRIETVVHSHGGLTLASGGGGTVHTDGTFTMTGGSADLSIDGGIAEILGGNVNRLRARGGDTDVWGGTGWIEVTDGNVDIFGGDFGILGVGGTGTTWIYGSGFNFPYGPVGIGVGLLTGTLQNGQQLSMQFSRSGSGQIVLVPEPASLAILAIGAAVLLISRHGRKI